MLSIPGRLVLKQPLARRLLRLAIGFGFILAVLLTFIHSADKDKKSDSFHLPQQRRIHEVTKIQNNPERNRIIFVSNTSSSGESSFVRSYISVINRASNDKDLPNLVYDSNYSLPVITVPKGGNHNKMPYKPTTVINGVEKSIMTALAMEERGMSLTKEQGELIKGIDLNTKEILKEKISTIRKQQEKSYFLQLRARGQIQLNPAGGERILSSSFTPVRFPSSLKKIRPENWEGSYRIYLNLTHFPWARTSNCKEHKTTFAPPGSLMTTALASFPSSGNTWIRYLIESASGIFTGSLYDDSSLTRKGLYGESVVFDSGMTILQKTHGYTTGDAMHLSHTERKLKNHMSELNNRGVIIVRNPFKALISHRHLDVGGHTGYAPKSHFVGQGWKDFVTLKLKLWKEFYIDWLEVARPEDLHLVLYEDLKSSPMAVVKHILKFLHLPIDERRLDCLSKYPDGMFKRKPSKNLPLDFNPFNQELKDLIYQSIEEINEALVKTDKDPLPVDRYEMFDSREVKVTKDLRQKRTQTTTISNNIL